MSCSGKPLEAPLELPRRGRGTHVACGAAWGGYVRYGVIMVTVFMNWLEAWLEIVEEFTPLGGWLVSG